MNERSSGLVMRVRPLTDTSLIVHWLTPDLGRIATVAKGARQPKSPFAGKLDLCFGADFSFVRSRRSELHALREVVVRETHSGLRADHGLLVQAAYAVAFIEQVTETETPLPEIHDVLAGFLAHLPSQPPRPRSVFAFELRILAASGLAPDAEASGLRPGSRDLLGQLTDAAWPDLAGLQPAAADARAVRDFLHGFILQHCQKIPRGRAEALRAGTEEWSSPAKASKEADAAAAEAGRTQPR